MCARVVVIGHVHGHVIGPPVVKNVELRIAARQHYAMLFLFSGTKWKTELISRSRPGPRLLVDFRHQPE